MVATLDWIPRAVSAGSPGSRTEIIIAVAGLAHPVIIVRARISNSYIASHAVAGFGVAVGA